MKFFKERSRFRRQNQKAGDGSDSIAADGSFGSRLAPADQFDILVRRKNSKVWKLFDQHQGNHSVSTMTSDEGRFYNYSSDPNFYKTSPQEESPAPSPMCCFSVKTDATDATDNTLLHRGERSNPPSSRWSCCPGSTKREKPSLEKPDDGGVMLTKSPMKDGPSLFDTLSEDGDQQHEAKPLARATSSAKRKWRSSLRNLALSWKKTKSKQQLVEGIQAQQ
jgi:hypothetical protein